MTDLVLKNAFLRRVLFQGGWVSFGTCVLLLAVLSCASGCLVTIPF